MGTKYLLAIAIAGLAFCVWYASAGPAGAGEELRDVKEMTVEELLEEFHHPPYRMSTRPVPQRRIHIINALRRLGEPLVQNLKEDVNNPDTEVKIAAEQVLANLGEVTRAAVPELVEAMGDGDERVRMWAVRAVGQLKDPRAFYALVRAANDPSPMVRSAVLQNAHDCLADGLFAAAAVALSDVNRTVRRAAIYRLRMLKDQRAVPLLMSLLDDKEVRSHVVVALESIIKPPFRVPSGGTRGQKDAKARGWQQWWKEHGGEFVRNLYPQRELRRPTR